MSYPDAAWERALTVQEVLLKALGGELHWFRAAEILGWSPRRVRRWRERYEAHGYAGLVDKRLPRPSRRRVPPGQAEFLLRLYRDRSEGLPMALYTDRAHWAFHTPKAKGPVDKTRLTQVGRALAQLGIEHIPSYSPQARGWSERLNRTFQDRLVNELRVAGIQTLDAANRYLAEQFLPAHNATFARAPRDPASAFVPLGDVDLDPILCHAEDRIVARDNTVSLGRRVLQIAPQPGRRSCAELRVTVREHLDGRLTIAHGARSFGTYAADGRPVDAAAPVDTRTGPRVPTRRLDRRPRPPTAHKRPQASL